MTDPSRIKNNPVSSQFNTYIPPEEDKTTQGKDAKGRHIGLVNILTNKLPVFPALWGKIKKHLFTWPPKITSFNPKRFLPNKKKASSSKQYSDNIQEHWQQRLNKKPENPVKSPNPIGIAKTTLENTGIRQVTLRQFADGSAELELNKPKITCLVLSGAGATGAAYPGAIQALEDQNALDGIKTINGSSSGAMTAAILASGMDAKSFTGLSDSIDLVKTLDSNNENLGKFQQWCSRLGSDLRKHLPGKETNPSSPANIADLLCNVLPRMNSEALPLEQEIRKQTRNTILRHIQNKPDVLVHSPVVDIQKVIQSGEPVTFKHLEVLSQYIPQIKTLNITGTAMFKGKPQLVIFNANTTPDMDIATAAHISAAFPFLFRQPEVKLKDFAKTVSKTKLYSQDGGVMLNTPVPDLIDRQFSNNLIPDSENLIITFEKSNPKKSPFSDWIVGGPVSTRRYYQTQRLKEYQDQIVEAPLKTDIGDFQQFPKV